MSNESAIAKEILKLRAESDNGVRDYLLSNYWRLYAQADPEWFARNMGSEGMEVVQKELERVITVKANLNDIPSVWVLLRILHHWEIASNTKLLGLLERYARGKTKCTEEERYAAAMLLVEAGYKSEHFGDIIREKVYDPATWGDTVGFGIFGDMIYMLDKTFFTIASPERWWDMVSSLPPKEAKMAKNLVARLCSMLNSPQQNGVKFLSILLGLHDPSTDSGYLYLVRRADRVGMIETFAQYHNRSDRLGYNLMGSGWQEEQTAELRFARYQLLIYGRSPETDLEEYGALIWRLDWLDRKQRFSLSIDFAKAYFGDRQGLIRLLGTFVAGRSFDADRLYPEHSLGDLIRGTDFSSSHQNEAFASWALQNIGTLNYDATARCWRLAQASGESKAAEPAEN